MKNLVIKGNMKLGPAVGVFNIPPISTCKPSKWCAKNCYARHGKHGLPNVKNGSNWRLRESKKKDFVERMVKEIKGKWKYFRIHASGDFYSDDYVDKWIEIIKQCDDTIFLAFTKRDDLKDSLKKLEKLKNVRIRDSLDPSRTKPVTGLKSFAAIDNYWYDFSKKGMVDCGSGCEPCGYKCWTTTKNIVLHEH